MKEKVLEILHQLGFAPEFVNEYFGYKFNYEELTMLFIPDDGACHTVSLTLPGVFDVTEENRVAVLEVMEKLAGKMKFVQPVIVGGLVWLHYQHFLGSQEPTPELLEHMIRVLAVSSFVFYKFINNEDNGN